MHYTIANQIMKDQNDIVTKLDANYDALFARAYGIGIPKSEDNYIKEKLEIARVDNHRTIMNISDYKWKLKDLSRISKSEIRYALENMRFEYA